MTLRNFTLPPGGSSLSEGRGVDAASPLGKHSPTSSTNYGPPAARMSPRNPLNDSRPLMWLDDVEATGRWATTWFPIPCGTESFGRIRLSTCTPCSLRQRTLLTSRVSVVWSTLNLLAHFGGAKGSRLCGGRIAEHGVHGDNRWPAICH